MSKESLNLKNYYVTRDSTIKEAMEAINDNQRGAVVIVDENKHVVGVVSDGEIRRALVKGREILSQIESIMNMNPVTIIDSEDKSGQAKRIFEEKKDIHLLPVINQENQLVDVIIRNPEIRK